MNNQIKQSSSKGIYMALAIILTIQAIPGLGMFMNLLFVFAIAGLLIAIITLFQAGKDGRSRVGAILGVIAFCMAIISGTVFHLFIDDSFSEAGDSFAMIWMFINWIVVVVATVFSYIAAIKKLPADMHAGFEHVNIGFNTPNVGQNVTGTYVNQNVQGQQTNRSQGNANTMNPNPYQQPYQNQPQANPNQPHPQPTPTHNAQPSNTYQQQPNAVQQPMQPTMNQYPNQMNQQPQQGMHQSVPTQQQAAAQPQVQPIAQPPLQSPIANGEMKFKANTPQQVEESSNEIAPQLAASEMPVVEETFIVPALKEEEKQVSIIKPEEHETDEKTPLIPFDQIKVDTETDTATNVVENIEETVTLDESTDELARVFAPLKEKKD